MFDGDEVVNVRGKGRKTQSLKKLNIFLKKQKLITEIGAKISYFAKDSVNYKKKLLKQFEMSRSNNRSYWKRYATMHWHFRNIAATSNPYDNFQNFNHRHDAPCKFTKSAIFLQ